MSVVVAGDLLVDGVARYHDHQLRVFILDYRLAAQPRGWSQAGRPIQEVFLGLFGLRELVESLLDDHMASGAGAIPAACMLQVYPIGEHHIQDRTRLAVVLKWRLGGAKLNHPIGLTAFENYS